VKADAASGGDRRGNWLEPRLRGRVLAIAGALLIVMSLGVPVSVLAAAATHLSVSGFTPPTIAGVSQVVTVTALDNLDATDTDYNGTVHFTSSDPSPVLPSDYTFTPFDNGSHTFSVTLNTVGTQTITATDTVTGSINGSQTGITVLTLVSIAVTPAGPSIVAGLTEQFVATGHFSDLSTADITDTVAWASSDHGVATIDATGLATGVAAGQTFITATLAYTSTDTTLTVTAPTLVSIVVTPAGPSIALGLTEQFVATGHYTDLSTADITDTVTWASATHATATIDAATGLATSVAAGTSLISATLGVVGSTTLTVTAPTLVSIVVTPAGPSIALGLTEQFVATGHYTDLSTADITDTVTWASATHATATIDAATGLATSVAAGTSLISATLGVVGSTTLTVTAPTLVSIVVTPAGPSIALGLTEQFVATGHYTDLSTADITDTVTWASATHATATIDAATGLATSVAAGTSLISATLGVVGSTTLTVTAPTLVSIVVTPAGPSIALGLTEQFVATGHYTDLSTADITDTVTWASATHATATIDAATGLATSVAAGTSLISATLGVVGSTTLTVTAPTLVSIVVTPAGPSIALGLTEQFVATGHYTDLSTADITDTVTWASATHATATIDAATGLATSVAAGTSLISATLGVVGSTTLTVTAPTLVSIVVTPAGPSIALGLTEQFVATGHYTDLSTADITDTVTWASATHATATIDAATGLATSVAAGTSLISATLGVVGSTTLTVTAPTLVSIVVTPAGPSIALGLTEQFVATGHYTDLSTADITDTVTWASATHATATIDAATGLATSVAAGTSLISATLGVVGSTTLTVTAPTLVSIVVTPAGPSIALGLTEQFVATGHYTDLSTADITDTVTWASATHATATIDAATGLATSVAAGTSLISATLGVVGSTTLTVTAPTGGGGGGGGVAPGPQTITFTLPAGGVVGTTATLTGSATSKLPLTYTSTTMGVCTVSGSTLSLLAAGTCSVTASQAGDGVTWAAATPVSASMTVTATVTPPPTLPVLRDSIAAGVNRGTPASRRRASSSPSPDTSPSLPDSTPRSPVVRSRSGDAPGPVPGPS
jgi:hypothetical protein